MSAAPAGGAPGSSHACGGAEIGPGPAPCSVGLPAFSLHLRVCVCVCGGLCVRARADGFYTFVHRYRDNGRGLENPSNSGQQVMVSKVSQVRRVPRDGAQWNFVCNRLSSGVAWKEEVEGT